MKSSEAIISRRPKMIKYIVYARDDSNRQYTVKKIKREYEALDFITDMKNLGRYGCMDLVKETDSDGRFLWDSEISSWVRTED